MPYMYIGPTSPQLGLKQATLYLDPNPPALLQPYIDKSPLLGALYVPTSMLGEARKNLRTDPNSVERLAYKAFTEIVRKIPR